MATSTCIWSDIDEAAKAMANNHRSFSCFAWHSEPLDSDNWAIVYTHNRDSGILDESNAAEIAEALKPFEEDAISERHDHWACGWVDGFALRVYRDGEITEAFKVYCQLQERLSDYPVLDEEDFSNRETKACLKWIEQEGQRMVSDDATEDWPNQVYEWLGDSPDSDCRRQLENCDGTGAAPDRKFIKKALFDLQILAPEWSWQVLVGEAVTLDTESQKTAVKAFRNAKYHAELGIGEAAKLLLDGEDVSESFSNDL